MAKILVVDDESNIRLMLRLALQASGHEVETAADGPQALEKWDAEGAAKGATARGFDLILLDQRMPQMEGLEVLRALKSRDPEAKIIMITAFGTVDLALAAQEAGAGNFLRKPFTTETLRNAVAAALENPSGAQAPVLPPANGSNHETVAINGFRLEMSQTAPGHSARGDLIHRFAIALPDGDRVPCQVIFSPVFVELVKAQADRDVWDESDRFWLWLGEEALTNYLWQNAAPPPGNTLVLEELSPNLRRWMDAVGSV